MKKTDSTQPPGWAVIAFFAVMAAAFFVLQYFSPGKP
jgi:hypothetical protein